jgi:hypothetical protein
VFAWFKTSKSPAVTTFRLLASVWTASASAWASWLDAIVWVTSPPPSWVWVLEAEAEAVAETELVWVTFGVSTAGVVLSVEVVPASAAGVVAKGAAAVVGSPVHTQFQIQLHEQAWSNEKLLVTPFDPVQVQFQIQRPATGETVALAFAGPVAPAAPAAAAAADAWDVAIQDQIQLAESVGASSGDGIVPSDQVQFQIQEASGTTTLVPGRTTLTLMLFSPVVVADADVPSAEDVFDCVAPASWPGLPIRTEMLTFVGLVCCAVALEEEAPCADVGADDELPVPALDPQLTLHSLIDWPTVEEFDVVACASGFEAEAPPVALDVPVPDAFAAAVFDWPTAPLLPGLAILTLTFTLLAPGWFAVADDEAVPSAAPLVPAPVFAAAVFD